MRLFVLLSLLLTLGVAQAVTPQAQIAEALDGPLKGFRYNKRLATPNLDDHLLLFTTENGQANRLVAWTESNGEDERFASTPVSPMKFTAYDTKGKVLETFEVTNFSIIIKLTPNPVIYAPERTNDYLLIASAMEPMKSPLTVLGPKTVELTCEFSNPLDQDLFFTSENPPKKAILKPGGKYTLKKTVNVGRPAEPIIATVDGLGIVQQVVIQSSNPLKLEVWPSLERSITLDMYNPAGSPFNGDGEIYLVPGDGSEIAPFRFRATMGSGEKVKSMRIPLNYDGMLPYPIKVLVKQRSKSELGKEFVLAETPPIQFMQLPVIEADETTGLPTQYEGRTQGNAHWNMSANMPKEGAPVEARGALVLVYSFKPGGISIKVRPNTDYNRAVVGTPAGYGLWVYGDDSGNFASCGMRDARNRVFQPDPIKLDWKGWRYLTFRWPEGMEEPLSWDSVFTIINADKEANGAVFINNPSLLYELEEAEPIEEAPLAPEEPEIVDRRNEVPSAIPIYNLPQRAPTTPPNP